MNVASHNEVQWVPSLLSGLTFYFMSQGPTNTSDPDVIIVGSCGFDVERARKELRSLTDNSSWQSLRAVQDGEVYIANGNHFYNHILKGLKFTQTRC